MGPGGLKGRGKRQQKEKREKKKRSHGLWKGALAIGAGTAAAMAIVASAFS
jgi:hypothetical protein